MTTRYIDFDREFGNVCTENNVTHWSNDIYDIRLYPPVREINDFSSVLLKRARIKITIHAGNAFSEKRDP